MVVPLSLLVSYSHMRNRIFVGVQFLVTLGMLGLLFWQVGTGPILGSFSNVVWGWVIIRVALHFVGLALQAFRWYMILRGQGVAASLPLVFLRNWTARFLNMALPSQLGGDAFRALGNVGAPASKTTVATSIVLDRLIGLTGLFTFVALAGLLNFGYARSAGLAFIPLLALGGIILVLPMIFARWPADVGLRAMQRLPTNRFTRAVQRVFLELRQNTSEKSVVAKALTVSILIHAVSTMSTYASFRALGVDVPLTAVILIVPMVNLASQVPVSLNGIGVREGLFAVAFGAVGVPRAEATAVALFSRVINAMMAGLGGLMYLGATMKPPRLRGVPALSRGTEPAHR